MALFEIARSTENQVELHPTVEGYIKLYCSHCQRIIAVDLPNELSANAEKKRHGKNSRTGCNSYDVSQEVQHLSRLE